MEWEERDVRKGEGMEWDELEEKEWERERQWEEIEGEEREWNGMGGAG